MGNIDRLRGHRLTHAGHSAPGLSRPPLRRSQAMRSTRVALAALLFLFICVAAHAALPTFWQTSTEAEFLRGEFENLSLDSYGRLTLGPAATALYESNAPFLWTLVTAPDGTVYAGSGNEGQVFRIAPDGKSSVFFDSEELEVHAIALAPGGGVYVGTS